MTTEDFLSRFLKEDVLMPVCIFGGIVLIVGIKTIGSVLKTNAREKSRREIAAFIAEGTISPEQGERLMKADPKD